MGITIEDASISSVIDNQSNIWFQLVSKSITGSDGHSYYAYVYSTMASRTSAEKITVTTNSGLTFASWFGWNTLGYTANNLVTASSYYDGNGIKSNCGLSLTPNAKSATGLLNIGICSANTVGPANGVTLGYTQLKGQSIHQGFGLYDANSSSSIVDLQVSWSSSYQPTEYVFVGVSFLPSSVSQIPPAVTPIQHIVIIMQENHAFDNMFGTFPGFPAGYSENMNTCMPINSPAATPCIKPWNANSKQGTIQGTDIPHTRASALTTYNNGAMNGFVKAIPTSVKNYTMAYYNGILLRARALLSPCPA